MKKLNLSRETIRRLDDIVLGNVRGGEGTTTTSKCNLTSGWTSWACCKIATKPDV